MAVKGLMQRQNSESRRKIIKVVLLRQQALKWQCRK